MDVNQLAQQDNRRCNKRKEPCYYCFGSFRRSKSELASAAKLSTTKSKAIAKKPQQSVGKNEACSSIDTYSH